MPLTTYRRHSSDCPYKGKGRRWSRCNCAIWVQGSLGGEYVRQSLNLTVWGAAQERIRGWEASGQVGVVRQQRRDGIELSDLIGTMKNGRPRFPGSALIGVQRSR